MAFESYGDIDTGEAEYPTEADERDAYDQEVDEMLEALMESEPEDLTERRGGRRGGRGGNGRRPVPTAGGQSAYRSPTPDGNVTQKQLKDALERVGGDVRRNAAGIKAINTQVGTLSTRVDGIVTVNTTQSRVLARLDKQMQLDGALSFAQALQLQADTSGGLSLVPNFSQLLAGAIKTGMIGGTTGAFSNPAVVGSIAFLLSNTAIVPNLLGGARP